VVVEDQEMLCQNRRTTEPRSEVACFTTGHPVAMPSEADAKRRASAGAGSGCRCCGSECHRAPPNSRRTLSMTYDSGNRTNRTRLKEGVPRGRWVSVWGFID